MVVSGGVLVWAIVSLFGLFNIILQGFMPELVPGFITSAFVDSDSEIKGVNTLLQAVLIVYVIGGYILFLSGLFMAVVTYKRNSQ